MTEYICKCGFAFEKNTEAACTAVRLADFFEKPFGQGHPCFGCPFVGTQTVWNRFEENEPKKVAVCFACKSENKEYFSLATTMNSAHTNLMIHTNDLGFIGEIFTLYARELLITSTFDSYKISDDNQGRNQYSLSFPKNALGEKVKKDILDAFFIPCEADPPKAAGAWRQYRRAEAKAFRADGAPVVMSSAAEGLIVEHEIYDLKESFKNMEKIKTRIYERAADPAYDSEYSGAEIYFVKETSTGRFRVCVCSAPEDMDDEDACFTSYLFRSCDTFEQAQAELDRAARNRGWMNITDRLLPEGREGTDLDASEESQLPAGEFDELYEDDPDPAFTFMSSDECPRKVEGVPEQTVPAEEDSDELSESDAKPEQAAVPIGKRISLRDEAFYDIVRDIDDQINSALRYAVPSESNFEVSVKISFQNQRGAFTVTSESGYKLEQVKFKSKVALRDDLLIAIGNDGVPLLVDAGGNQTRLF